eukprot:12804704-Heterocapsa_arctica.AAC.1
MDDEIEVNPSSGQPTSRAQSRGAPHRRAAADHRLRRRSQTRKGVVTGAVYSTRSPAPRSTSRSTCPTTSRARGSASAARR